MHTRPYFECDSTYEFIPLMASNSTVMSCSYCIQRKA